MTAPFDPSRGYGLNPVVALRPEPFAALADHFGNRRLPFLKAPELVRGLGSDHCVSGALAAVPEGRRDAYLRALASLASLAAADMIVPQTIRSEAA